jgi:hypothetical protein
LQFDINRAFDDFGARSSCRAGRLEQAKQAAPFPASMSGYR